MWQVILALRESKLPSIAWSLWSAELKIVTCVHLLNSQDGHSFSQVFGWGSNRWFLKLNSVKSVPNPTSVSFNSSELDGIPYNSSKIVMQIIPEWHGYGAHAASLKINNVARLAMSLPSRALELVMVSSMVVGADYLTSYRLNVVAGNLALTLFSMIHRTVSCSSN